ncbi:MAG TPA: MipA/OmpV family protein [Steroidobacteraceae bacterium]|nr:MipA/OmpV family protein [Steroidobacteraceae bacterium]
MDTPLDRLLLTAFLLLAPWGAAVADEDGCKGPSGDCVAVGSWNFSVSLGAGIRTNPIVHESDIPLVVVPQFSYYGKRFFIDNLDGGVTLLDGDSMTLSLIASPGYDRVFFYRSDLQNVFVGNFGFAQQSRATVVDASTPEAVKFTQRPRYVTYLAGPEWTFKYSGVTGQLDVLHEITGHNHGDEIRAALGIPLSHAGGTWGANAGFTWKSAAIVNYYYGSPGLYDAGAALNPFVKVAFSRPLSGRWKLTAFVECERLANAIFDSPIVNQRYVTTTFVGTTYVF